MTLDVLTWPVHGSYMRSLAHVPVRWLVPVAPGRFGYGGRGRSFDWPANVVEVPIAGVHDCRVDVVVYQHRDHYDVDRWDVLTPDQRAAPAVFVEHDPPRLSPTDTVHPVTDPSTTVVHVTPFNALMWDTRVPSRVIDHGIEIPSGVAGLSRPRGIVVINDLGRRGRRLGLDVFLSARRRLPLELVGMGAEELGGRGEVPPEEVVAFVADHRFLFSPIRYTSLGLGILEAMAAGVPVVGLATTELANVVRNGVEGFVDTDPEALVEPAERLLADRDYARRLGAAARRTAASRFGIARFAAAWGELLAAVAGRAGAGPGYGGPMGGALPGEA